MRAVRCGEFDIDVGEIPLRADELIE